MKFGSIERLLDQCGIGNTLEEAHKNITLYGNNRDIQDRLYTFSMTVLKHALRDKKSSETQKKKLINMR